MPNEDANGQGGGVPAPRPAPQPIRTTSTMTASKAWDWAKNILVILVIPLMGWGVKLEVGNAQRDLRIEQLQEEKVRLERRIDENANIDDKVQQNALKLVQLEGKLDTANGRLDEIKDLLRDRR